MGIALPQELPARTRSQRSRFGWLAAALVCVVTRICSAADTPPGATLPLEERVQIATQIRSDVEQYFAHWQGVGNLDFDTAYTDYLKEITRTNDRRTFDLATMKLFASLANAHTDFMDNWLLRVSQPYSGLRVHYVGHEWVVINTQHPELPRGTVITSIDGRPIDDYYADKSRYIYGSDDLARRNSLFNYLSLFETGMTFNVGTPRGKTIRIDRRNHSPSWLVRDVTPKMPDGVAYTHITRFDDPRFEDDAIAFLKANVHANTIIIDVRGNKGGNTPSRLLTALITQPYRDWTVASAMSVGLLKTYGSFIDQTSEKDSPESYGFQDGMNTYFNRPMMYWPGRIRLPDHPIYTGRLIVLTDSDCASSCEDFVMPLKASHRATIVGDRTYGSSGQPITRKVSDDITYRISAKRMFFADGAPFEGVGIAPDVKVVPTLRQIRANEDPVLTKALELARQ